MEKIKVKKEIKGISLITLVITIVVIIILTAAIVLSISQNNPIDKSKEATFKTNVTTYKDELSLWIGKEYVTKLGSLNLDEVNATKTSGTYNNLKIQDIITSIKNEDLDKFEIQKGQLIYVGTNEQEKVWVQEIGTGGSISNPSTPLNVANAPKLPTNMLPVIYDEAQSKWVEVTNEKDWYNYDDKLWANATTENGSYFVWIPRYAYKITSGYHMSGADINPTAPTLGAGTIDIIFLQGNTNKNKNGNDIPSDYIVHPAFEFDGPKEGIWVGKYESSSVNNQQGASGDKVKIVPNVVSWRSLNVSTMFAKAQNMASENNLTNTDTHMLKNTEWGAVVYLAHSKYGRNGIEVTINNNSNYKTGFAGGSVSAASGNSEGSNTFAYNTSQGVLASTTGNITGIYDMSGGAYEYVMGLLENTLGNSGFSTLPASKYYDTYKKNGTGNDRTLNYSINSDKRGDAIYETSSNSADPWNYSWFQDYSVFIISATPWFIRGGYYSGNTLTGILHFDRYSGGILSDIGFRAALVLE